ncbi:MAG: MFS transporter [Antricoccus sp.]
MTDAIVVSSISVLPLYLTAGLAVQISAELDLSLSALGASSAAFFGAQALFSPLTGALVDRLGVKVAMRCSTFLVATLLLLAGLLVRSFSSLLVVLVIAGLGNAVAQPATNQFVAERIVARRQGVAYGAKQSAIPTASLLAGLAVPVLGITLGWRWTFGTFALIVALLGLRAPGGRKGASRPVIVPVSDNELSKSLQTLMAFTSGIAAACGTSMGVYLVSAAVATGWSAGAAGVLFAAASLVGILCRFTAGWQADRFQFDHLTTIACMMLLGAAGCVAMMSDSKPLFIVGALAAFGLGWGWPGLFIYAVVMLNPARPAAATAFTQVGTAIGAVAGPLLFGLWIQHHSFAGGWAFVGAGLVVSAVLLFLVGVKIKNSARSTTECVGENDVEVDRPQDK